MSWRPRWAAVQAALPFVLAMILAVGIVISAWVLSSQHRSVPVKSAVKTALLTPPVVEEQRLIQIPPEAARDFNAKQPIVAAPVIPASAYRFVGKPDARERAIDCLAAAAWYEAGDDASNQRAVIQVILNRARHPAFPSTVCGVVFQGSERSTGCQFTFTCDGALARTPSAASWARARSAGTAAIDGTVDADVGYATHYHANYVVPYWQSSLDKVAVVGPHLFYRWKGFWGTKGAFTRKAGVEEPFLPALARLSPAHALANPDLAAMAVPGVVPTSSVVTPPPALVIEGVREKSLRGAVVRGQGVGQGADANRYFLQLDAATFPGNYATAAVALCKNKPNCAVLGWREATKMAHNVPLTDDERQSLTFYFTQHEGKGDRALWNCDQINRPNKTQCLSAASTLAIPGTD
ncbi:cell wall hydrolase [Sphingomonas paeninsulae]|jgi:spore germination cell wall hydrolase CwlJ-like protein|uniref:Cell wall hydrolase n=2 Tax=Sphingomonas paeninsulae TaxID=2319844 RepID=A0A494TMC6_SPHPE|nr:cell wall hydrolase [Sphingomonas paeninsulae]